MLRREPLFLLRYPVVYVHPGVYQVGYVHPGVYQVGICPYVSHNGGYMPVCEP